MVDELKTEGTTEAAPVQEPPKVDLPAKQSEPAPLDPRFVQALRETEERLTGKLGAMVDRKTRTVEDGAKQRYDELSQKMAEIKSERLKTINQAVAAGLDPAGAANMQREMEIELFEREQQARSQQQTQYRPDPRAEQERVAQNWNSNTHKVLDTLDLTGDEPEAAALKALNYTGWTYEDADADFRKRAKQVAKAVDARVHPKEEPKPKMTPPPFDAGAGGGIVSQDTEGLVAELDRLNHTIGGTPKERADRKKRAGEIDAQLAKT